MTQFFFVVGMDALNHHHKYTALHTWWNQNVVLAGFMFFQLWFVRWTNCRTKTTFCHACIDCSNVEYINEIVKLCTFIIARNSVCRCHRNTIYGFYLLHIWFPLDFILFYSHNTCCRVNSVISVRVFFCVLMLLATTKTLHTHSPEKNTDIIKIHILRIVYKLLISHVIVFTCRKKQRANGGVSFYGCHRW